MIFSKIKSVGSYLPKKILTNADLEKMVDTSNDWIIERTGILQRHIISENENTTSMAVEAAKDALQNANMSVKDIDMVVVATCTPDKVFPSTACLIQEALQIPPCPAFDVQAACSGFIYGLSIVDQYIKSGAAKNVLFVASESMSRIVDWQDRKTCVLFGDGAGAVIVESSLEPGILSTKLCADGKQKDVLYVENTVGSYIQMQGNVLFRHAVNMLDKVASDTLKEHHFTIDQIDWLVPHQANIRIIKATVEKLQLPMEKVILTLQQQGNTSAASIPLALAAGVRDHRIKRDQYLLLESFGAGLTWGTALIKY